MDDLQAIRRMKRGDIGGLEVLVARYQTRAVRTAYLITHDEQLAEDVAQETFVQVYQRIGQFDELRPFQPYFLRSVANAALNAVQKDSKCDPVGLDSDVALLDALFTQAMTIETQVEYRQLKQEVASRLASLPPRQRAAIVLRYYLEMSEKEMAESLTTPPGTVKWLLNTARESLRELLGSERSAE
ncbi:MAG: RNA polymerase sigma factor [Chloroflexi bacterium]|jgi:RNA polymerase sigma-70 factor (ECF subfamily)|nr:RNA polymerase sigma factor [Chloroflexota bacterium]